MKVIGISGKKGSGKNYIAEVIAELAYLKGKSTREISFADKLKDMCSLLTGINLSYFYDQYAKENMIINLRTFESKMRDNEKLTFIPEINHRFINHPDEDSWINIRTFLQYFGTGVMHKAFGPFIWVNSVINSLHHINSDYVIIPDVRFKHEAEAIKRLGGVIVRVDNKYADHKDSHISENDLNHYDFDFRISNDYDGKIDNSKHINDQVTELFNTL